MGAMKILVQLLTHNCYPCGRSPEDLGPHEGPRQAWGIAAACFSPGGVHNPRDTISSKDNFGSGKSLRKINPLWEVHEPRTYTMH
jgi:hypothetical protein